jgi:diketogulonate reductase-like aldo/keto reductase
VNFRTMLDLHRPVGGRSRHRWRRWWNCERGLVRHIGLSNVTMKQVEEAPRFAPVACVQNMYNPAHRDDDAMTDTLAAQVSPTCPSFRWAAHAAADRNRLAERET